MEHQGRMVTLVVLDQLVLLVTLDRFTPHPLTNPQLTARLPIVHPPIALPLMFIMYLRLLPLTIYQLLIIMKLLLLPLTIHQLLFTMYLLQQQRLFTV
jgi:hypothetical protein